VADIGFSMREAKIFSAVFSPPPVLTFASLRNSTLRLTAFSVSF